MSTELPLLVRSPVYGLRVFRPAGEHQPPIVLQWLDEGGPGQPWEALLIRVAPHPQTGALHWLLPPDATAWHPGDARVLHPLGTRAFRIELPHWPAGCRHALLLSAHVLVAHGQTRGRAAPYSDAALIAAVRRCLADDGPDALQRTLIHLPDVPNEPNAPDAPDAANEAIGSAQGLHLALGSCHYPHDIFDRMPHAVGSATGPADASLLQLADLLERQPGDEKPSLLVLTGDQVYLDATAGLFDPKLVSDRVLRPYELYFGSAGAQRVFCHADLQSHMLVDDHELQDNYAPGQGLDPELVSTATEAYWVFQRGLPPGQRDKPPTWRRLQHRGFAFFLGDTRLERSARRLDSLQQAQIMGPDQRQALKHWLLAQRQTGRPSFIATPSIVLPRRLATTTEPALALASDAWDGFPAALHELLALVCFHEVRHLVLLSGDEHLSCHARITLRDSLGHQVVLHSIHSSALYAPYPFANGQAEWLAEDDHFEFEAPGVAPGVRFECQVQCQFAPPGDGFATLKLHQAQGQWWLRLRYHGGQGLKPDGEPPLLCLSA